MRTIVLSALNVDQLVCIDASLGEPFLGVVGASCKLSSQRGGGPHWDD